MAGRLPEMILDDPHHRSYIEAIFKGHEMTGVQPQDENKEKEQN
jgi:hypothetical protein